MLEVYQALLDCLESIDVQQSLLLISVFSRIRSSEVLFLVKSLLFGMREEFACISTKKSLLLCSNIKQLTSVAVLIVRVVL